MRDTAGSPAALTARCRKFRRGSFIFEPPFTSFDHLVGGSQQLVRHSEAEHPGGRGVDDEFELARLHDPQIRRLCALEGATGGDPNLTKPTDNVRSVAHQPTDFRVIAHRVDRREPVECCQLGQLDPSTVQERGDPDEDGIGALATNSFEGGIDLRTAVGVEDLDLQPNGASRRLHLFHLGLLIATSAGLTSRAMRAARGTSSPQHSSRFAANSTLKILIPVMLLPGRARLATRSSRTGSTPTRKRMGIVVVAALAANVGGGPAVTITATPLRTRSAASSCNRSGWFSAQRYAMTTFSFSI